MRQRKVKRLAQSTMIARVGFGKLKHFSVANQSFDTYKMQRRKNRNSHKSIWHIEIKSCTTARLYSYHSAQINRFSGSMQIHRIIGMCVCVFLYYYLVIVSNEIRQSRPFHFRITTSTSRKKYIYLLFIKICVLSTKILHFIFLFLAFISFFFTRFGSFLPTY